MNKKNTVFLCTLLILVMLSAACQAGSSKQACQDALGCVEIAPDAPIHIAYALVITGPNETLGLDDRNGIELAIVDKSKILGHEIEFTGVDDGCSAEGGRAAGAKLAADPSIIAVLGPTCSSGAREAVPLLSKAGLTIISASNTAPDLTEAGNPNNHPGYLRTAPNDNVQGKAAAKFAIEYLKINKAATINDGSSYAIALQQVFADEFKKLGGEITAQEAIDPNQKSEIEPVLTRIAANSPGLIYFPIYLPAGGFIISQAKETPGLENTALMGADGLYSADILDAVGKDIEGFLVSGSDSTIFSNVYTDKFLPAYRERFGQDPVSIYHAHAYDAAMLIFAAIEKVALQKPDGSLVIGRQALRDAMYATKDYKGITGNLTCSPTGDCADPHIAVFIYHNGEFPPEKIWP